MPTLEEQIQALSARLRVVEARLDGLDGRAAASPEVTDPVDGRPSGSGGVGLVFSVDGLRLTTALGRSLIILGGAFLLRALTDAGTWPPRVGVSLGLLYGLAWMGTSAIAARRQDRVRGLFDGATALVIGFPLIVEATFRFKLLTPVEAGAMLAIVTMGSLAAAFASTFETLAWLASVGGMATGLTLMVGLGVVAPFSLYFTALGVAALWLGYLREWTWLRWPTGLLAVAIVQGVTVRTTGVTPLDTPAVAWFVQSVLVGGYGTSVAVRTLGLGRQVIVFELVETVLAMLVGVGGALFVSQTSGAGALELGIVLVVPGVVAYWVAFRFLAREPRGALNFYYYSTVALVLVLAGVDVALAGAAQSLVLTALAAVLAVAWSRSGLVALGGHVAVALVVATFSGGLAVAAGAAFFGALPDGGLAATAGVTLAVALAISASKVANCATPRPGATDLPALVIALVALAGAAGVLTLALARLTGVGAGDPGALATVRTALLSALAVTASRLNRPGPLSSVGQLAYPLLVATGLKLVITDLGASTASTLFVALGCYGMALVLVPRMHRA